MFRPARIKNAAEFDLGVWLDAFGDTRHIHSSRDIILTCVMQGRAYRNRMMQQPLPMQRSPSRLFQIRPKTDSVSISTGKKLELKLDLQQTSGAAALPLSLTTRYWRLTVDSRSLTSSDALPLAMRQYHDLSSGVLPARGGYDLWSALTRRWRAPQTQSVIFWLNETGLRRSVRSQKAQAIQATLRNRIESPGYALLFAAPIPVASRRIRTEAWLRRTLARRPRFTLIGIWQCTRQLETAVTRRWASPDSQRLSYWLNRVGLRRSLRGQRSLALQATLQNRILPSQQARLLEISDLTSGMSARISAKERFKHRLQNTILKRVWWHRIAQAMLRNWRHPNETALLFWRDEIGYQRNVRRQTELATEIVLPIRHFTINFLITRPTRGNRIPYESRKIPLSDRQLFRLSDQSTRIQFKNHKSKWRKTTGQARLVQPVLRGPGFVARTGIALQAMLRTWRNPREQGLSHWLYRIRLNNKAGNSPQLGTTAAILWRYGVDSGAPERPRINHLSPLLRTEMDSDFNIQTHLLPASRWQIFTQWLRLAFGSSPQTPEIDLGRFFDKLLDALLPLDSLEELKPLLNNTRTRKTFVAPYYSTLRQQLTSNSEHAALICIAFIAKALNTQDPKTLQRIFLIAPDLSLPSALTHALTILAQTNYVSPLTEQEKLAVQLFLRGVGVQLDRLEIEDDLKFDEAGISLLQAIVVPHRSQPLPAPPRLERVNTWVVSGRVPVSVLGHASGTPDVAIMGASNLKTIKPSDFARATLAGVPFTPTLMTTQRIAPYSKHEDDLSILTRSIAKRLITALRDVLGPHDAQVWLEALELPLDDLLFASTLDFWSLMHNIRAKPRKQYALVAGTANTARAYLAGLRAFEIDRPITMIAPPVHPSWHDNKAAMAAHLLADSFDLAHSPARIMLQEALSNSLAVPEINDTAHTDTTLLFGRNFDRNYRTDLTELGRALQKDHHVYFIPTAGQRDKNHVLSFFDTAMSDWHDDVLIGPTFELWSPLRSRNRHLHDLILPAMIRDTQRANPFNLEETALILCAARQLNVFFRDRIFKYFKSGAATAQIVETTAPKSIVLMPGRDYISRVAAFAGRPKGVASFDVQTVFVGPRSRYIPSVADLQFAIETQSKKLFEDYFKLPSERTVLTGCAKVGLVQQTARSLNRDNVRSRINMQDKSLLVFACSPFLEEDQMILESLAAQLENLPQVRLGVRLHPTAKPGYPEYMAALAARYPAVFELTQLDLPETLIAADILITRFSNVGLEAALLGTNVIACNFNNGIIPIRLDQMGVATVANSSRELQICIRDFAVQGPLWQRLQDNRATYIANNQQLFSESAASNMIAVMNHYQAKSRQR